MEAILLFLGFLLILLIYYYFLRASKGSGFGSSPSVVLPQASKATQRKHPRTNVDWPISMETPEGKIEAKVKNISVGGAFICFETPLSVGDIFHLTMMVPDNEPIEATAKVVGV